MDAEVVAEQEALGALVGQTAAFAHTFLRWIDVAASDGLTLTRLRLLERLHCQGPAMMRTLADELDLSPRNMTALVDGLETDALVARRPHPTDRRATMIELTTDGYAAVEAALGPALGAMSCLFTDLSPEQRRAFSEAMDVLKAGIKRRMTD
jgi:DNA-binding MarR family transcriptional regulator